MKLAALLSGVLLLAPPVFAHDLAPFVTNGKRLAAARHQLETLPRNATPWSRIKPLLRTLIEEDPQNASHYVALSIRKSAYDEATSPRKEKAVISRAALIALRKQEAAAESLLAGLEPSETAAPPPLVAILAWVRREIAEIENSSGS